MPHERYKSRNLLTLSYHRLGTISEAELIEAVIDDIKLMKEKYGVKFYTGAQLQIWGSNEQGDPRYFLRGSGSRVKWLNTSHYRPACLDYDL